jgi:hypothetical protein
MLTLAADAPVAGMIVLQNQENKCDQRLGYHIFAPQPQHTGIADLHYVRVMTREMPYPLFRPPQPYTQLRTPFSMVPDGLIVASGS